MKMATETILQNVKVLAVDQSAKRPEDEKIKVGKTVTLALNATDSEKISLADSIGELTLSLRGVGDNKIIERNWEIVSDARLIKIDDEVFTEYLKMKKGAGINSDSVRIYNGSSVMLLPVQLVTSIFASIHNFLCNQLKSKTMSLSLKKINAARLLFAVAITGLCVIALPALVLAEKGDLENIVAEAVEPGPVYITLGKAELIDVDGDIADVLVANPAIIDVMAVQSNRLYIVGLKIGDTNIIALDENGDVIKKLDIHVKYDLKAIQAMVNDLYPDEDVKVKAVHDQIVMTGTVSTPEVASRITERGCKLCRRSAGSKRYGRRIDFQPSECQGRAAGDAAGQNRRGFAQHPERAWRQHGYQQRRCAVDVDAVQ
jgi:hypothetical protein